MRKIKLDYQAGAEILGRLPVGRIGAALEIVVVVDHVGAGLQRHRGNRGHQVAPRRKSAGIVERGERAHRNAHEGHPERPGAAGLKPYRNGSGVCRFGDSRAVCMFHDRECLRQQI